MSRIAYLDLVLPFENDGPARRVQARPASEPSLYSTGVLEALSLTASLNCMISIPVLTH